MVLVSSSNVAAFEGREFDPDTYEEGGSMNFIRWRHVRDEDGNVVSKEDGTAVLESNCRMVRWSDGSVQLLLGDELLAADEQSTARDKSFLFYKHPKLGVVQGQGQLLRKMRFRPIDLRSKIHRHLAQGLESKYRKMKKVKNMVTTEDPDKEKERLERVRGRGRRAGGWGGGDRRRSSAFGVRSCWGASRRSRRGCMRGGQP